MKKLLTLLSILLIFCIGMSACRQTAPEHTIDPTEDPTSPDLNAYKLLALSFEGGLQDSSPLNHTISSNKNVSYTEGINGKAIVFDGATYIDLGTSSQLQPAALSFSAWIRADSILSGEHMLTWFKPNGNYQGEGWYLSCLDDNTPLKLSVGKSAGQPMEIYVSGSRSDFFPLGQWVHIAVTYDSSTHTCAIYRNGIAQAVTYINTPSEINGDDLSHKYIGFNSPRYNGGFAKLAMDEVELFSTALTSSDIVRLYTQFGAEFDAEQVVRTDHSSLNLPASSLSASIVLPTVGASGSTITWTSSNDAVLSSAGIVNRPASGEDNIDVTLTATICYGNYSMEKTFYVTVEAHPAFSGLSDFSMGDVTVLDAYEANALSKEIAYLKSLDADKLLTGFCTIAGLQSDAALYGGWESTAIKGHTLGHYLTAVSQAYATTGDPALKAISDHIVTVLAQCQNPGSGYLAAIPETHYNQLKVGNTAGTWVPWYTMHKVLAGLVDCYELIGNDQALTVAEKLGNWVANHTATWTAATQATVLNVEYGGMNDVLYRLYGHTGSADHLAAAHSFDEMDLFDSLYNNNDVLNGLHANTTIPKILGALQRYIVLGGEEEYYLQVAENFWQIVVSNHTYITGGNSEWEHFGEPNVLDAERTNCNCETCNTYNMLKLTRELFKITGNRKYSDYYENTFINAILSSQNPETGMTTYFQPMATGFFKVYSTPFSNFWCCTGSGMENFSKLSDSIYYRDNNSIYVIRYTSSSVRWAEKGLTLTQETDFAKSNTVRLTISGSASADIVLRIPDWCAGTPTVTINGKSSGDKAINGFIRLSGDWRDGDVISYTIPMKVVAYTLPDSENTVAFKYGPYVLSADLGSASMNTGTTGVSVTIPLADSSVSDIITVNGSTAEAWLSDLEQNMARKDGTLQFTIRGTNVNYIFSPHYQQHTCRYGIYFHLYDADSEINSDDRDKYTVIDSLPIANDQYEFSHNLQADKTGTGTHLGRNYRHAEFGGWFSYDLAVEQGTANYLQVQYFSGDAGRTFSIYVENTLLSQVTIENMNPGGFYDMYYQIPAGLLSGKESVTVTFKADGNGYAGGIFEKLSIVKEK